MPLPLLPIIGAGLGAVGSLFGGISASRAAREAQRKIEQQAQYNQAWFDRRYNEDPTQRADAQRAITLMQDKLQDKRKAALGRSAVMGATEESINAQNQQDNQALGDTISRIHSAGEAQKEGIEHRYQARKQQLDNALMSIENQRAQAISKATEGLLGVAGNIATLGWENKKQS